MFKKMPLRGALREKEKKLDQILDSCRGALVSFSGGTDSAFLLYKAAEIIGEENILAVTAVSPIRPASETKAAGELAALLMVPHRLIQTSELSGEPLIKNSPDRCYHCKRELYVTLVALSHQESLPCVLDGSNWDDLGEHRPGSAAAREYGIRSPLQEAELTKKEIRLLSRRYRLPIWNRPANSCLATRFPHGEKLDLEKLERVEKGEEYLRSLGLRREIRVRSSDDSARIEVTPAEISTILQKRTAINSYFKYIGFIHVSLDLEGYHR